VELVRSVLSGSEPAWRRFLTLYGGLIEAMIRRYLGPRDREEVHSVTAEVLESLYLKKLAHYEGRAALSTWLTLVTRNQVLDHLRRRFGRRHPPQALRRLAKNDREIFRLYYVEGWSFADVLRRQASQAPGWNETRLLAALRRIEAQIGDRWLRRLAYDLHAQSVGAASGRLMAYLDHVRDEFKLNEGAHSPDYHLMEREARAVDERLHGIIASLPEDERRILSLRFERGWSARRIADELGLSGPRGAYTLLDRIVRGLRRRIGELP
jgi:DNA-directed RNA polymerase specialized sigma24 family protein